MALVLTIILTIQTSPYGACSGVYVVVLFQYVLICSALLAVQIVTFVLLYLTNVVSSRVLFSIFTISVCGALRQHYLSI